MISNPGIGQQQNILTLDKSSGRTFSFRAGSIVRAEVVHVNDKGSALLRISAPGTEEGNARGTTVKAYSEVPLTRGQNIFLEILQGKGNNTMRFIGDAPQSAGPLQQNIPLKLLTLLSRISEARLGTMDFHQLITMLKSLPPSIRAAVPEFQNLEKLLLNIDRIDGKLLKAFIETSGVAYETRLRIALMSDPGSMLNSIMALQAEGDLKLLLMKLQRMLRERSAINALKGSGLTARELSKSVEGFIRNIEFFQLTAKINDMFYAFLPVLWDDLKDGEFLFRKDPEGSNGSCTCDINLDLETLGKLSLSVTAAESSFYITFTTERHDVKTLLLSQKQVLESRFLSMGLDLKAVNVNYCEKVPFGRASDQGIRVKA